MNRGWTVALIIAGSFAVGRTLTWLADTPAPVPQATPRPPPAVIAAPAPSEDRQELLTRQLCDKEVAILLESRDLADLIRAATVIHQVNCGIEKRL